jgi:hypothetical protein
VKEDVKELSVNLDGSELDDNSTEGLKITEKDRYFEAVDGVMEGVSIL